MTKDAVRSLIENGRFRLCRAVSKKCQEFLKLEPGTDMELEFRDMVYVREPEGNEACSLKYNTMTNYQVPKEEFRKYKENHCGFWKGLIWLLREGDKASGTGKRGGESTPKPMAGG